MPQVKAYPFQLRCKPAQEKLLRRFAGGLRWIWNHALAEQQRRHVAGEPFSNYIAMAKWLTAWRCAPDTCWLAEGPMHPQQQVLKRLEVAYKRFFSKAGGFPSFKRHGDDPGIRYPDPKQFVLDQANGRIKLPKLGWVRLRQSQKVEGELRNVSLRRDGTKWLCCLQVQTGQTLAAAGLVPTLGLDAGITVFAAGSDGCMTPPLKAMKCQQQRLRRYQKSVSRKCKGSKNRKKAVARLGNLHRKIARQRSDWLHKLTTALAGRHPVIAIEDLKIKNMSASAKGTAEKPGKNVNAKSGLNKAILDAAWGEFARQLEYKLGWRGGELIKVNPAYTSQKCSACGHTHADNRKSQAAFACLGCGHKDNADSNAARNILAAGHAAWAERKRKPEACGEVVRREAFAKKQRAASVKQEPTEGEARASARADSAGIPVV